MDNRQPLEEQFPIMPLDWEGNCSHGVGLVRGDGFNCTICGWFIPRQYKRLPRTSAGTPILPADQPPPWITYW